MAPRLRDLEHGILHSGADWYCGHPRQAVYGHFDGDEVVVGHNHAPCAYARPADVRHDLHGYHSRAVALLQRSADGGRTWPAADEVVIYDETRTEAEKREFLYPSAPERATYDMLHPEALTYFGRTYLPTTRDRTPVCFALRSPDRGRTWEATPTIVEHPDGPELWVHKDCHPVLPAADGKGLLAGMSLGQDDGGGPALYASDDHGLSWHCRSRLQVASPGRGTYVGLLRLPNGPLQCYFLHIGTGEEVAGPHNAICVAESVDEGCTWSAPRPIVCGDEGSWGGDGGGGKAYRSPWPILLRDGRILVLFARRRPPMGIGAVVSTDGGHTWSDELVIRSDATHRDLGYPVGSQLADGRIFTAYYYNVPSSKPLGGVRYIASSHFRIPD